LDNHVLVISAILSLMPVSELRGAIPYAIAKGIPPVFAYLYCVAFNSLVGPVFYIFISTLHKVFVRFSWYNKFFDHFISKARNKIKDKVARYGYVGILLFVAIPLPITGAYTGTMGAWILGMQKRKTIPAVIAGVLIAGIIVTIISYLGLETFSFLTKKVNL
jgi:uncharacterized membrane protein